ncbi:MAG: hypothetical protein K8H87_18210 [Pseudorhodoplanes sp.]|nr:hypothetical protein [Pseudorhodoplanes sp.]
MLPGLFCFDFIFCAAAAHRTQFPRATLTMNAGDHCARTDASSLTAGTPRAAMQKEKCDPRLHAISDKKIHDT